MKNIFLAQVIRIQRSPLQVKVFPTVMVYVFIVWALDYFIIQPKKSPMDAFILGVTMYGVYEFTNSAIFIEWSPVVGIVDTLWGGILFSLTTYLYIQLKKMKLG